jgi:K+-transporting ATPase c subunit
VVVVNVYLAVAALIYPIFTVLVARVTVPSAAKSRLTAVAAALAASRE